MSTAPSPPGVTSADPPPARRPWAGILLVGAVVALGVAAVASLVLADRGDSTPSRSPEETVEQYYAAADQDDCETMLDLVSVNRLRYSGAGSRSEAMDMCTAAAEAHTGRIEVLSTDVVEFEEGDDYAIVSVELSVAGDRDEQEVFLYLEGDEWKLFDSDVFDET